MLTRLFRFDKYEDIDAKDFAEKTGMNVKSVASMIKQAVSNATLYDKMLAAGYSDAEFPDWWYSPGRAGGEGAEAGKIVDVPAEAGGKGAEAGKIVDVPAEAGGKGAEAGKIVDVPAEAGEPRIELDKVERVEGYEVTPPRQPAPREGRPALQAQRSDPILSDPIHAEHVSPPFSDAELSLLAERGITEITPGRWMHTEEQADSRIVLTRAIMVPFI